MDNEIDKNDELYKDIQKLVRSFMTNLKYYREQNITDDEIYELCYFDYEINRQCMIKKHGDFFSFEDFVENAYFCAKENPQWFKK